MDGTGRTDLSGAHPAEVSTDMTVLQRLRGFIRPGRHLIAPLALLGVVGLMVAMRPTPTALERVQARGELVVATRPSLTTVYRDPNGLTGMRI